MKINFVISKDLKSKIFIDIFQRFIDLSDNFEYVISEKPNDNCDLFHYHRFFLEKSLIKPSVITIHHDLLDYEPWISRNFSIDKFLQATHIICLNNIQKKQLEQIGLKNTTCIPHGYDDRYIKKSYSNRIFSPKRKIILGVFSKNYERRVKNDVYFLELAYHLSPERYSFIFCGEGRYVQAQAIERLGFDCKCYEVLPYNIFCQLYKKIDFLLMASRFEGGPANIPEAIGAGVPILTTKVGIAAELIENGVNGYFISGNIKRDESFFMDLQYNKNNIFNELKKGAYTRVAPPTWKEVINMHEELYKSIIKEN